MVTTWWNRKWHELDVKGLPFYVEKVILGKKLWSLFPFYFYSFKKSFCHEFPNSYNILSWSFTQRVPFFPLNSSKCSIFLTHTNTKISVPISPDNICFYIPYSIVGLHIHDIRRGKMSGTKTWSELEKAKLNFLSAVWQNQLHAVKFVCQLFDFDILPPPCVSERLCMRAPTLTVERHWDRICCLNSREDFQQIFFLHFLRWICTWRARKRGHHFWAQWERILTIFLYYNMSDWIWKATKGGEIGQDDFI